MEQPRAYNYFNRSPELELAAFLFFAPALVTFWVFSLYYFYFSGAISLPLMKSSVYLTAFFIAAQILYRKWRAVSKFRVIVIEEEKVVTKSWRSAAGALNFADIKEISAFKIPYIKEWIVLKSPQKSVALPLGVHGGRDMVERIFNNVREDAREKPETRALREELKNGARRANMVQNLREKQIPVLIKVIGAAAIFNCAAAIIFWESAVLEILIWGCASMFFPLCAYFLTERAHVKYLLGGFEGGRKKSFAKNYLFAGFCGLMANMVAGFFC